MNESNYGDLVWDFVERLIEEKKDEKQVVSQVNEMLDKMIKRDEEELKWLKKIKKKMMKYFEESQ